MHRMTFGRLTGGFSLLGLLAVEVFLVIAWATTPPAPEGELVVISTGEVLFWGGLVGLIGGAALGLFVWAIWRVWCWFTPRQESEAAQAPSRWSSGW